MQFVQLFARAVPTLAGQSTLCQYFSPYRALFSCSFALPLLRSTFPSSCVHCADNVLAAVGLLHACSGTHIRPPRCSSAFAAFASCVLVWSLLPGCSGLMRLRHGAVSRSVSVSVRAASMAASAERRPSRAAYVWSRSSTALSSRAVRGAHTTRGFFACAACYGRSIAYRPTHLK